MRPIRLTFNTSKSVNERSFMRRMGFIPFIGRVLSHIITADVLFTRNLFYTCENCPSGRECSSRGPKHLGRSSVIRRQYAHVLQSPFFWLPVAANVTPDLRKMARNYVLSGTKSQNGAAGRARRVRPSTLAFAHFPALATRSASSAAALLASQPANMALARAGKSRWILSIR